MTHYKKHPKKPLFTDQMTDKSSKALYGCAEDIDNFLKELVGEDK